MKIVREGQKHEYLISEAMLAGVLEIAESDLPPFDELDFSSASDNGNSVRVEQDRNRGTLTAGAPGYAAVTTVVAKRDGTVLAVFGQQFYVARAEQGDIAEGELPVREFAQASAAAAASTEAHTETEVAPPETKSPDAATNELDENTESVATV
jgi:hypothetical protein